MKNKKIIIIISITILLSAVIWGVFWFLNRKFEVTFDYSNDIKSNIIKVKYGKTIDKKYVKGKNELGKQFMYWYEITTDKDGNEFVSSKEFNFDTKIKKDTYLKAKYEEIKKITVRFETNGGSDIPDIILEEGQTLTLPENPTKENHTFIRWEDKHETPIYNDALLGEDITLYAIWEKKEEGIELTLTNKLIHPNSKNKELKANVTLENTNDKVTYTLSDNKCVSVDDDGKVTFKNLNEAERKECFEKGKTIKLTASLPSGKSTSASFEIEKDLVLKIDDIILQNDQELSVSDEFTIKSNLNVTWKISSEANGYKYTGEKSKTATSFNGTFDCKTTNDTRCATLVINAVTASGQEIKSKIFGG